MAHLNGGQIDWITAGHCGYTASGNCWYHEGYAGPNGRRIGCEINNRCLSGFDYMRVGMFDNQATEFPYGTGSQISPSWLSDEANWQGALMRASRGKSDDIANGTVTVSYTSWTSDKCNNSTVSGMDTTIPAVPGDSGSPVYWDSSPSRFVAGILNNQQGNVTYFDSCAETEGGSGCSVYAG